MTTKRSVVAILVAVAALIAIVFFFGQSLGLVGQRPALLEKSNDSAITQNDDSGGSVSPKDASSELQEYSFTQLQMAMPMRITVWCESKEKAQSACKLAFRRASELVKVFSDYDRASEASRLAQVPVGEAKPVSDDLLHVLEFSRVLNSRSKGAFDPTASPLVKLWRKSRKSRVLPSPDELETALVRIGFDKLKIDSEGKAVTLLAPKMAFDFGGIAKGYIGDQVIQVLRENGVSIARYRAGGDMVLGDAPPATKGWTIGVGENDDATAKTIQVSNCGVSTSGDSQQFVEVAGKRYSHVIDPRTGMGLTTGHTAFVIAPRGMQSDALATTGTILGENDFQSLLKQYNNTTGWIK